MVYEFNIPTLELIFVIFSYFLFKWAFRGLILIIVAKVVESVKKQANEKLESLKGGLKKDNENL